MTSTASNTKICPYPGLRPFTEEESNYFKGRDIHVQQIITQLEEKKFVMLTGASGDGKSSVVYAGVIPNVRAGFFKAKFNKWVFVDFRPERSPLKNMAGSLAEHLGLEPEKVEQRIKSGFSSLIEVYKSSQYYLDTESDSYISLDEKAKKEAKRKAANLFILVDQFEEFFTNTENFSQGRPTLDAQLVVNILLETAKIAFENKLPIYIIFTMRSDFIGQCAAFRGLPEYIGYSQFFVPRLKRKEIYEVIEEPAKMSENRISRRLLEMLIFELHEGFDQLPVLQHALNQLWKKADNGEKEMDLIHLAMLSGLPVSYLTEADQGVFREWYEKLLADNAEIVDVLENDFSKPSLENVLNTHANELYNSAAKYYEKNHPQKDKITSEESKQIIKTAFQCMTKINASRAVRNRMSLQEITQIINLPDITAEKVGGILNIFREQGNTFISPFIFTEEPESKNLKLDTVLDITHESLIRNWALLNQWAKEENENWQNFLDFNKQLQRWLNSDKSRGYLLPIGPLTFFENWFNRCKPNKYWLVKYDESDRPAEEKLQIADETVRNAREFLKRSARKLFISRTIIKYGAQRIAAIVGIIFLISAITYYTLDFRKKRNSYVIKDLTEKGIELMNSKFIKSSVKAKFMINYERMHPNSFNVLLDQLSDTLAFEVAIEAFISCENLSNVNRKETNPFLKPLTLYIAKLTDKFLQSPVYEHADEFKLNKINLLINLYLFIDCWDKEMSKLIDIQNLVNIQNKILQSIVGRSSNDKKFQISNISIFNHGIDLQLCLNSNQEELLKLLDSISPFEGVNGQKSFASIYPKEKRWGDRNRFYDSFTHNGGYQILSYLYASQGDYIKIERSLDSIMKNNPNYFQSQGNGFFDIMSCLIKYKHFPSEQGEQLIKHYTESGKLKFFKIVDNVRNGINDWEMTNNIIPSIARYEGSWIYIRIGNKERVKAQEYYLNLIKKEYKTQDDLNFNLALYFKSLGILVYRMNDTINSFDYFKKSFEYYEKVSDKYRSQNYILGTEGADYKLIRNSIMFLYPTNLSYNINPFYPFYLYGTVSFPFLNYILTHRECFKFYQTSEDAEYLQEFLLLYYYKSYSYHILKMNNNFKAELLNSAYSTAQSEGLTNRFSDTTIFELIKINELFSKDSVHQALVKYSDFRNNNKVFPNSKLFGSEDYIKQTYNLLLRRLCINLALNQIENARDFNEKGQIGNQLNGAGFDVYKEIFNILNSFPEKSQKRNTIIDILLELQKKGPVELTFSYLDSLFLDIDKTPKYGQKLFRVLGMIGSKPVYDMSVKLMKNIKDEKKPSAIAYFIQGVCYNKNYYQASNFIPDYFSSMNELELINQIIHSSIIEKKNFTESDIWHDDNYEIIIRGESGYESEDAFDYIIFE